MATLRQNTKFYTTRAGDNVVGNIHRHPGWLRDVEYPLAVSLPMRNIVRFGSVPARNGEIVDSESYRELDDLMAMDNKNFQIIYSFPVEIRNNIFASKEYGAPNVTMRQLYDFLCTTYNGGERFVDAYFDYIFPASPAGREYNISVKNFEKRRRHGKYGV
jgi:hypothetical protein